MRQIVVTGATSFIGVHFIKKILSNDVRVYAVIRKGTKNKGRLPQHANLQLLEVDLGDLDTLALMIDGPIDAFYHLAWEGARGAQRDDSVLQNRNIEGAIKAMDAAVALKAKLFFGSGSQAEYGDLYGNIDEEHHCEPRTQYGKAKYEAYCKLSDMAQNAGIKFIWARIFSIYGCYDYSESLIMTSIRRMLNNESIQVMSSERVWDYLYVEDLAEAMHKFMENDCESGIYNIASGETQKLGVYIEKIKECVNSKSRIEHGDMSSGTEFSLNVNKINRAIGWSAHTSFEAGITKILNNSKLCNIEK